MEPGSNPCWGRRSPIIEKVAGASREVVCAALNLCRQLIGCKNICKGCGGLQGGGEEGEKNRVKKSVLFPLRSVSEQKQAVIKKKLKKTCFIASHAERL